MTNQDIMDLRAISDIEAKRTKMIGSFDEKMLNDPILRNDDKLGIIYKRTFDEENMETQYRIDIMNLFSSCVDIMKENHYDKKFNVKYKNTNIVLNMKDSCFSHLFGFDEEKIFTSTGNRTDKVNKLINPIINGFSNFSLQLDKLNGFVLNLKAILLKENELYKDGCAFNYSKMFVKLSTYVNYKNMENNPRFYVNYNVSTKNGKKSYDYGIGTVVLQNDKWNVADLKLIQDDDEFVPYSLVRNSNNQKIWHITTDSPVTLLEEKTKGDDKMNKSSGIETFKDCLVMYGNNPNDTFYIDDPKLYGLFMHYTEMLKSLSLSDESLKPTYDLAIGMVKNISFESSYNKAEVSRIINTILSSYSKDDLKCLKRKFSIEEKTSHISLRKNAQNKRKRLYRQIDKKIAHEDGK